MYVEISENPQEFQEWMANDPKLAEASLSDEHLYDLKHNTSIIDANSTYLNIYKANEKVAMCRFQQMYNITGSYHIYIASSRWGNGDSLQVSDAVDKWILDNTICHKITNVTPQCCEHVLKAAMKTGFRAEGILIGATFWRGKIENIVLLSKFLKGS